MPLRSPASPSAASPSRSTWPTRSSPFLTPQLTCSPTAKRASGSGRCSTHAFPMAGRSRRSPRPGSCRDAVRQLLDDTLAKVRLDVRALEIVNGVSASVSTTLEASQTNTGFQRVEHWHAADPTALPLAAAARSAIEIVTDTASVERLRRCANADCSMLFVNGDSRRQWCTPNICGNRARVARHYHRHRPTEADL